MGVWDTAGQLGAEASSPSRPRLQILVFRLHTPTRAQTVVMVLVVSVHRSRLFIISISISVRLLLNCFKIILEHSTYSLSNSISSTICSKWQHRSRKT